MRDLVLGNGTLTLAYDQKGALREVFSPFPGQWNHTLGAPCHLGVLTEGVTVWITEEFSGTLSQCGPRRAVLQWNLPHLGLTVRVEDQLHDHLGVLQRRFSLKSSSARRIKLLLHHDLRLLECEYLDSVSFQPALNALLHHKRGQGLAVGPWPGAGHDQVSWTLGRRDQESGRGIRALLERNGLDNNPCAVGAGESILALDLELEAEKPERATTFLACWSGHEEGHRVGSALSDGSLIFDGHAAAAPDPSTLEGIAQVSRHQLDAFATAFIASPDSEGLEDAREHYGYIWPRDGAFVAMTCTAEGRRKHAHEFFRFCARVIGSEGFFLQRYHPDGFPGSSWHPSFPPASPLRPIQSDSTALTCLALARYLMTGAEDQDDLFHSLLVPMADFLLRYRQEETGLPLPSHDLWEERFGIHTFTVAATLAALRAAGHCAAARGSDQRAEDFLEGADVMEAAMKRHLFHKEAGRFARTAHPRDDGDLHLDTTVDASLAGLFLFEPDRAGDDMVVQTMKAVEEHLVVRHGVGGVARYQDDSYHRRSLDPARIPGNPWIICTLWLAQWHGLQEGDAHQEQASHLLHWVVNHARPSGLLPEQVHPLTGESVSVCPLLWSHSTFLDTLRIIRRES